MPDPVQQGFPTPNAPLVTQDLRITQPWLQALLALWRRTGGASGDTSGELDLFSLGDSGGDGAGATEGFGGALLEGGGEAPASPFGLEALDSSEPLIFDPLLAALMADEGGTSTEEILGSFVAGDYISLTSSAGFVTISALGGGSGHRLGALDQANTWNGQNIFTTHPLDATAGANFSGGTVTATDGLAVSGAPLFAVAGLGVAGGTTTDLLHVTGTSVLNGGIAGSAGITVNGGVADFTAGLNVSGGALTAVAGALVNALNVTGPSTLSGSALLSSGVTVNGAIADFTQGLNVSGAAFTAANGALVNALNVTGPSTLSGSVLLGGGITVNGAIADFTDGLNVSGGALTASSGLLANSAFVTGPGTVSGAFSIGGLLTGTSGANFSGAAVTATAGMLTNQLFVTSGATINGAIVTSGGIISQGSIVPLTDNAFSLGAPANRFTDVYAVSGSVNPSDLRLKKNVLPMPSVLGLIEAIQPITFEWLDPTWDSRTHWGFMAQQVALEFGEFGKDFAGHLIDAEGMHALRPHEFIGVLWQGLRELKAEVDEIKQRLPLVPLGGM